MYYSYFDKPMMENTGLEYQELRDSIILCMAERFASAINDSISSAVIPDFREGNDRAMAYLHGGLNYDYPEVPGKEAKKSGLFKKKKRKEDEPKPGTRVEQGEIIHVHDPDVHYTNVKRADEDMLFLFNRIHKSTIFVFINQYEMKLPGTIGQPMLQTDNFPREIKLHYTVLDLDQKHIAGGLIIYHSSSFDNGLEYLTTETFSAIGRQIQLQMAYSSGQ